MKKINLQKLSENIKKLDKKIYAVVKSDAYGLGLNKIVETLLSSQVTAFCVITIKEAIQIRKLSSTATILLLSPFNICELPLIKKYDITITIEDITVAKQLKNQPIKVQIEVNSGMNRFGISEDNFPILYKQIINSQMQLTGIYSHNANSDPLHQQKQIDKFQKIIQNINTHNIDIHYQATNTINHKLAFCNAYRIGALLYQNIISIYGTIIKINTLNKQQFLGYESIFQATTKCYIAIVNKGYADGILRTNTGNKVIINQKAYQIVGNICMNHLFILVDKQVKKGDQVEFIGSTITLQQYSNYNQTIIHESLINFRHLLNEYY